MASYSGSPGYTFATSGTTLDPLTDRLPPRAGSLMGGDAFSQAVIEDLLMGRGDQYSPGGLDAGEMFPEQYPTNPQEFIRQQLAGDVVMMPDNLRRDSVYRQLNTDPMRTMAGQHSINTNQSPYLDLLNILSFPGGGSMAPPIRRR